MKAQQALLADRKSLMKKLWEHENAKDAIAEEVAKIDAAIAALGGQSLGGAGTKPVAVKKKRVKNPKNAAIQKKRHAAVQEILKRPGNEKLTFAQADKIRMKEAKTAGK